MERLTRSCLFRKRDESILLASLKDCTACTACVSVCPQGCISMHEDKEGFLQPRIDASLCIECHKCEKICPVINSDSINDDFETKVYAVSNKDDEVRAQSSSGGVFFPLARWVVEQGGVVFGARWNDKWEVVHDYAEDIDGVKAFMRSKYVQSVVGDTLRQAKQFLDAGRWVLYSGTPCQLGGLRAYLGKEYEKLIQVDLICHGVPSPGVWRSYLKDFFGNEKITDINFRDKRRGWINFQTAIETITREVCETQMENPYFRGFLTNVYLRNSCYDCRFKSEPRNTDITLADYWGAHLFCPEMCDDKGTSLILVHSPKGCEMLSNILHDNNLKVQNNVIEYKAWNSAIENSVPTSKKRYYFFKVFGKKKKFSELIKYIDKDRLHIRIIRKLKKILIK